MKITQIQFYSPNGQNGFLSNYFEYKFILDDREWRTAEHYYQSQKFAGNPLEERIRLSSTPDEAKGLAHQHKNLCRKDWDDVRIDVMRRAVTAKFTSSGFLKEELLATGYSVIQENSHDKFWGIGIDGKGANLLGKILMETRDILRKENEIEEFTEEMGPETQE